MPKKIKNKFLAGGTILKDAAPNLNRKQRRAAVALQRKGAPLVQDKVFDLATPDIEREGLAAAAVVAVSGLLLFAFAVAVMLGGGQ